jgi:hypothetical protein
MNNAETQYTQAYTDGFASVIKYSDTNRQSVIEGVVSATGAADYVVGDAGALTAYATASTANPLILSFANGNSTLGGFNYDVSLTTDSTWTGLTASSTNYLFFDLSTAGAITTGFSTTTPLYGYFTTGSTGHFYNLNLNKMYVDSTTEVNRLFVGEAVTSTAVVTSVQAYALKGRNTVTTAALAVNQVQALNHAMGLRPAVDVVLLNLSANAGYFPGDEVPVSPNYTAATFTIATDATTIRSLTGGTALSVNNKTTSTLTTITMAKWAFKFYLSRPFDLGVV